MKNTGWSADIHDYALSSEYAIQLADPEEWGKYCSVYYNMRYIGFFREEGFNASLRNAYWIYKGESKVGGVRIAPNAMYHLFYIPPFQDSFEVLKLLKQLLMSWSDRTKPIKTYEILSDQVDLYARAGFWPDEFRCRWMQRPTEQYNIVWDHNFSIESPQIIDNQQGAKKFSKEDEIANCDFNSFKGSLEAVRRKKFVLEDFVPHEDPNYTNEILNQASTLVYDQETGQLIANCRLCLQDNQAAVYSVGVIPAYRGKGIATLMLQRALTIIKDHYPVLRLYVMEGNDAQSLYYNLGFVQGELEVQTMYIPAIES